MIFNRMKKRHLLLLISLMLILTIAVGGTLAYITMQTGAVVNTFTPASTSTSIEESWNGETKSNVKVINTGDIPAYVRVKVVITWKDGSGNILAETPVEGEDYTIEFSESSYWASSGGYYYYTVPVQQGASTDNLIDSCVAHENKGDYKLSVEILAQSVQAEPATAVQEAWGVTVNDDGTISMN